MTLGARVDLRSALLVLLLLSATVISEAQGIRPRRFDFDAQLRSPAAASEKRVVERGALLMPVLPGSEALYQPIVLCNNLELRFDGKRISQLVNVQGFCLGAGFEAVDRPEHFEWTITANFSPDIREFGCEESIMIKVRDRQTGPKGPWGDLGSAPWKSRCQKSNSIECIDQFDSEVQRDLGSALAELIRNRICHHTFLPHAQDLWAGSTLECWPQSEGQ